MSATMTRREMLQSLGFLTAGALAGCTPVRIALHKYPDAFDRDPALTERVIAAFVAAVIPGVTGEARDLARIYGDGDYPFAPYRAYFAADLSKRAERRYGKTPFESLDLARRARVIRDGLDADAITRQLYGGAIYLAQISQYAGVYDDGGCPLIGYAGANGGFPAEVLTYPNANRYLPAALTANGNYA
jgi:hypothetical protein